MTPTMRRMLRHSRLATATVFSIIRNISVPLGISDPERPNIASTLWRTVADTQAKRYYFESALSPTVFWVDLAKLQLEVGSKPMKLDLSESSLARSQAGSSRPSPSSSCPTERWRSC